METLMQYLSSHPWAVLVLIFLGLFALYFLFKQLVKLALIFVLILLGMAGYFYFQGTRDFRQALEKAKVKTGQVIEKGKGAYEQSKTLYEKSKEMTGDVGKILGKEDKKPGKE